jgi:hypothetical protein
MLEILSGKKQKRTQEIDISEAVVMFKHFNTVDRGVAGTS